MSDSSPTLKFQDYVSCVCNANLLVLRDQTPERVGSIDLPGTARRSLRSTAGTVLGVGPLVRIDVRVGSRVLFSEHGGMVADLAGVVTDPRCVFLSDSDVLAVLTGVAALPPPTEVEVNTVEELGLPLSWAAVAREEDGGRALCVVARPGMLLIELAETPLGVGTIIPPPGVIAHTKATEATIRSVGLGVSGFSTGDRIQLASIGNRAIRFGSHSQREFYEVSPGYVVAKYHLPLPGRGAEIGSPGWSPSTKMLEDLESRSLPEGDPRGLR